jgi:hypothetical protein
VARGDGDLFFRRRTGEDFEQQGRTDPDGRGRERQAYEGNNLAALHRDLNRAQTNDAGWPIFKGKYVEYPRFRKGWGLSGRLITSMSEMSWYPAP